MGSYLALKEQCARVPQTPRDPEELRTDLRRYALQLRVRDTLQAFGTALRMVSGSKEKAYYYLIALDFEAKRISITGYPTSEITQAMDDYREAERATLEKGVQLDTVLVSAESLNALRQSYPNYHLDTRQFIRELGEATG